GPVRQAAARQRGVDEVDERAAACREEDWRALGRPARDLQDRSPAAAGPGSMGDRNRLSAGLTECPTPIALCWSSTAITSPTARTTRRRSPSPAPAARQSTR